MAVGAIQAIDGGGTAMANFAGGMAKGFARGALFNGAMNGLMHLGNAHQAGDNSNSPRSVDNRQGGTGTDGHALISESSSGDLDATGKFTVTAITQGKSLGDLQTGQRIAATLLGNEEYNANSVVKAENDFLEAIRKHTKFNELTSSQLAHLQMRQMYLDSQTSLAISIYQTGKYGSLITGFAVYESLSRAELLIEIYQDPLTAKNAAGVVLEARNSAINHRANHPVINTIGVGLTEVFNRLPWDNKSEK